MLSEVFRIDNILSACEKILYFLKVNVLFLLSNIPLLLFVFSVGLSEIRTYLPLFLLCLVPLGPALSAVFFAMNRLLHQYDTTAWNDYQEGYTDTWGQKMAISASHMLLIWMFWTNIEFFGMTCPIFPLMILFVVLFAAMVLATPNLYLLTARYQMSFRDIWKGALMITITRPLLTLSNCIIFAFALMLLEVRAGTMVLFLASIYGFLTVFMNQPVFKMLDEMQTNRES